VTAFYILLVNLVYVCFYCKVTNTNSA